MAQLRMLVLAGLLFAPTVVQAQVIHGAVLDESTRAPIAGVLVELLASGGGVLATVQTNDSGTFFFRQQRSGTFSLRLTHLAYTTVATDTVSAGRDEMLALELQMAQAAIPLEPLLVTARGNVRLAGFHERMRKGASGRFVTRSEIERRPAARATELLREMPGINLTRNRNGTNFITMRGSFGGCVPTIYVDGMEMRQFAESSVDDFLTSDTLEGIEVYTGAASAPSPITPRDACGVVAFWSRADGYGKWGWRKLAAAAGAFALLTGVTLLAR